MGDLSIHFNRSEFACKCGCGFDTMDYETLQALERVRAHFGKPITVNSGCRCPAYNKKVRGSVGSQHLLGRAVDISVAGEAPADVQSWLRHTFPARYGIGSYTTFTHLDTRTGGPVRWQG
jgi:uncharacterized protein YcbK (DUF882 family)